MENFLHRITDPNISFGKPVIKDTCLAVVFLLEHLAAGDTYEELLNEYSYLEKKDILGCLQYAVQLLDRNTLREKINLPAA